jgi:hypothetical protein
MSLPSEFQASGPLPSATFAGWDAQTNLIPLWAAGDIGPTGGVVPGTGQNIVVSPREATFWEVGNFLFCAVLISTNTATPGLGSFTLPTGYAWTTNSQATWPQIICCGLGNSTGAVGGAIIANPQANQPGSGVNNILTVQATDATGAGLAANVNVLAWGPKAPV